MHRAVFIVFAASAAGYKPLTAVLCVVMAQFEHLMAGYERERETDRERENVQLTAFADDQSGSNVHLNYI